VASAAASVVLLAAARAGLPAQALTLQEGIALAQDRGAAARAARSTRDAARWRDRAFGARLFPQLALTGEAISLDRAINAVPQDDGTTFFIRQSQNVSALNLQLSQRLPFTDGQFFVSSGLSRIDLFGDQTTRYWRSTPVLVGLTQQIFRPRALVWDRREQALVATAAERAFAEAREQIAIEAATAFFDLHAAQVDLRNATGNAAVNDTLYMLSKGRYEVGKIGENDLLRSELAVLQARTAVDEARLEQERAASSLRRLLDVPRDADLAIVSPSEPPAFDVDPGEAAAVARRNGSRTVDLDLETVRARRRVSEARFSRGFGATLSAVAGFDQTAPVLDEAYRSPLGRQRVTLGVELPLVQWGAGHADLEAARADARAVASTSEAAREAAEQEAYFAARRFTLARRQLALAAKADTVAARRFDVAKNRYVIGKIDMGDLYVAQGEKDAAVRGYVQALRDAWLAYYTLRRLTLYDFEASRPISGAP
jgi:outer membrane protein TolC